MEEPVISGVAYYRNEAKLTIMDVPDVPGVAHAIVGPISDIGIEIDIIIQNAAENELTDFTFTVSRDDSAQTKQILTMLQKSRCSWSRWR